MTIIEFDFRSCMGSCYNYNYYVVVDEDLTTDQLIAIDEEFHNLTDITSFPAAVEAAMEPFGYHYKILTPDFTIYA